MKGAATVEAVIAILVVVIFLLLFASGCGYLSGERYTLLGCMPEAGMCRVFDTYSGQVYLTPLPISPAERGIAPADRGKKETTNGLSQS